MAFTGVIRSRLGGHVIDAEGVFTYRVDAAGKLAALRAYWEVDRAMRTARPAQ
ncbi:ketosteroid isomerase-like protein [Mycobacteroides abscessus subsp. abscessus]|nr:ketosteroid isomerase-like protein [Mycobacteroides abscessus subsp. abscessus]